jgi:hypothetical protein
LQASLAIGDLSTALYFLGKYPSFAQSHPSISDLILRIVKYALEPVYSPIAAQGLGDYTEDELGLADVSHNAILKKIRPIVPTLIAPCPPDTVEKQFEFFYPEWHHGLERWSSIQDIHDKGMRWLGLVRGLGGRDVETMVKICRIGAAHFADLQRAKSESLDGASTMDDKERSRFLEVSAGHTVQRAMLTAQLIAHHCGDEAMAKYHPVLAPTRSFGLWCDCGFRRRAVASPQTPALHDAIQPLRGMARRYMCTWKANVMSSRRACRRGEHQGCERRSEESCCAWRWWRGGSRSRKVFG